MRTGKLLKAAMTLLFMVAACRPASTTPTPAPTLTPTIPTPTPVAVLPTLPPEWTETLAPSPTSLPTEVGPDTTRTPSPEASLTPTADATLTDRAEFVADVTIPDGADLTPGTTFTKTWQVRNTGTATWTTDYALVFVRGDHMGGPDSVPFASNTPPGQVLNVSVVLTAPTRLGQSTGFWQFRNAAGSLFGIGPNANEPVYLQIDVVAAGATPGPTVVAGPIRVTRAAFEVDSASVTGACPHTFNFVGSFDSEGAGAVTYKIEAETGLAGFQFDLPPANEAVFAGPGPRGFAASYALEFRDSVTAQVWLHILSPSELISDKVTIALTCTP
jgi:hypothetical protein